MSTQTIVERILSDAEVEARAIIQEAENKAAQLLAEASAHAEKSRRETENAVRERVESIFEKKNADARLESAKILLREKRKVVDAVYALALGRLLSLEKEECLRLFSALLTQYAEDGDEIFFAENFKYVSDVSILPVIKTKRLKISEEKLPLDGGMRLIGQYSDKDLSYGALLAADKEENQAELAKMLFQ